MYSKTTSALAETLINNLADVESGSGESIIQPFDLGQAAQNEMLFFFKPECFLGTTQETQLRLVELAFERFESFGVSVSGGLIVSGRWLGSLGIMDRHYGYINTASRSASTILPKEVLAILRKESGATDNTPVLGGHEFLAANHDYDAKSLESLWASKKSNRLRSGLYYQSYSIGEQLVVLVNGFHPAQLEHFTAGGRKLVLLALSSDFPWKVLRGLMLGDTFPERGAAGSFRRTLHDMADNLGLADVSIANNFSHLSAGPFEALFELWNFLSGSQLAEFRIDCTKMWKLLSSLGVEEVRVRGALNNPSTIKGGAERKLFDLTEDVDSQSAAHLFSYWF